MLLRGIKSINLMINIPNVDIRSKLDSRGIHISTANFCSIDPICESDDVMHLTGLPQSATKEDILDMLGQHFSSDHVKDGNEAVHILKNSAGSPSGQVFVEIKNKEVVENAVRDSPLRINQNELVVNFTTGSFMKDALAKVQIEPTSYIVMTGLPFDSTEEDITKFFEGSSIDAIHVSAANNMINLGSAYVKFSNEAHADEAVKRHLEYWGQKKLEIYKITLFDFYKVLQTSLKKGGGKTDHSIYLRGIPFHSTVSDVADFLEPHKPCEIDMTDCQSGCCLVYFNTAEEVTQSMNKHLCYMGRRYIEIRVVNPLTKMNPFSPNTSDIRSEQMRQNANRMGDAVPVKKTEHRIFMRGLPFTARIGEVNEFFSPIKPVGVDLIILPNGFASGNANAYFATAQDAEEAMSKHLKYMGVRYIELSRGLTDHDSRRRRKSGFGSTDFDPWQKLPVRITLSPMYSGLLCNNNKSFLGRLLFGMRTSHMENTRGYHTLPVLHSCKTPALGRNIFKMAAIGRRLAKL